MLVMKWSLKLTAMEMHRELTGDDNGIILENIQHLLAHNARIIIRVPVIPDVNDDHANYSQMVLFLKSLNSSVEAVELLPYNTMARSKYHQFGKPYQYANLNTQSREKMEEIVKLFDEIDVPIKVGWGFGP